MIAHARTNFLKHHHVAFVSSCKSGRILASGVNVAQQVENCAIHAEAAAVDQFRKRVKHKVLKPQDLKKGITVSSIRVAKGGHLLNAKPCARCQQIILACPYLKQYEWSTDEGELAYVIL